MQNERDPLRKIPTKHAPEPKADIGSTLKAAREKRGHTLEAVSQQTRISRRYLEALEKNRFDEFPALAYLRGFLKSYCDYLEVEFEPLWRIATTEEHKEEQPAAPVAAAAPAAVAPAAPQAHAPTKPAAKAPAPAPKPKPAPKTHAAPTHHTPHAPHQPAQPAHPAERNDGAVLAVFALCALTIGSAIWLVRRPKARADAQPALPAALAPLAAHPQSRVTLNFRDDVWISVAADGKPVFEGRVPRASRQEWTAAKTITLKAVNPDAIQVTVNGAPVKLQHPDANGVYRIETP